MTLGATTTIEDSGLLPVLVAGFRAAEPGHRVRAITGGTGEILQLGRRGDADVLLTHDPAAESSFVSEGYGTERHEVMYNDFVVAGPAVDPAGIRGSRDAAEVLRRIAESDARFVSRGDDSGTHRKERELWRAAGIDPTQNRSAGMDWYIEAGVGMGDALRLASERQAYILTDRATLLIMDDALDLEILVEGDPRLRNIYGVTRIARAAHPAAADAFVRWITSPEGQRLIGEYGLDRFGQPLFRPSARSSDGPVARRDAA